MELRALLPGASRELDLIVRRSMKTMLETIPELERNAQRALQLIPNFGHEQMRAMYARDLSRPSTHQLVVAQTPSAEIIGHVIYFLKDTEQATRIGYLFTLYVDEPYRKRGVASALMANAVSWLEEHGARQIHAHTHVLNTPFIQLAVKSSFEITATHSTPWPHVALQRTCPTRPT